MSKFFTMQLTSRLKLQVVNSKNEKFDEVILIAFLFSGREKNVC